MILPEKYTLGSLALGAAAKYKNLTAFRIFRDTGVYDEMSYALFGERITRFAGVLRERGVKKGGRVMLLAENRPEWAVAYFGIALLGAVSVPVLTDFIPEQIEAIAHHAEVSAICVTEKTSAKTAGIDFAPRLWLDSGQLYRPAGASPDLPSWSSDEALENDAASIIYTSGTTGRSKGVILTHKNLVFTALTSRKLMKIYSRDRVLSVIPLAHTYECTVGLLTPLMSGASVTYLDRPPSPAVLLPAMQSIRPTAIVSVPLFIEKLYRLFILPKLEKSFLYRLKITKILAIKLAGARLMAALGSALRFFGVGGAPLSADTETFLRKAGFPYSTGYGLTETSPLVTGSAPYHFPGRSTGKALPGVDIRISGEGEIQVKGPNVMAGYYRDEERTKAAFTSDHWFKTGDLGYLDARGNLYIRGRSKALILGPSGENIYPEEIETILEASFLIEDALVVPGPRGELVALVVLSEKAKTALAALAENLEDLKLSVNKKLAAFSRLTRIEVRNEPFEKTPTQKIKRFLYSPSV